MINDVDDPNIHPDAVLVLIDNDCDGLIDMDDFPVQSSMYFVDSDGDLFGDANVSVVDCNSEGYVEDSTDCDDSNIAIYPQEDIDGDLIDSDCDGTQEVFDLASFLTMSFLVNESMIRVEHIYMMEGFQW